MRFFKGKLKTFIWSLLLFFVTFITISALYLGDNNPVSIKLDGDRIPSYEFNDRYRFIHSFYADQGVDIEKDKLYRDIVRRDLSIIMIREEVTNKIAKNLGLSTSKKEIDTFLKENNMLSNDFSARNQRRMAEDHILKRKLEEKLAEDIEVDEEVVKSYYEENKELYKKPVQALFVQLIYDNEELAVSDLNKLNRGVTIEDLGLKEENVIEGSIFKKNPNSTIENTLFNLGKGDYSDVVQLGESYSIFKLEDFQEEGYYTFEDIIEIVQSDYMSDTVNNKYKELIDEWMDTYEIEINI